MNIHDPEQRDIFCKQEQRAGKEGKELGIDVITFSILSFHLKVAVDIPGLKES